MRQVSFFCVSVSFYFLVSGHFVVSRLQLAIDGSMLVHPSAELLLIGFNVFAKVRHLFLTLAGAGFGILEPLGEIADNLLERFLLCQSDGLGSFKRLHVVGDNLVLLSQLHDSGLVVSKTVIGAFSLNLEGGELLRHLIVLLVGVLGNHLSLLQLLFKLLDTLSVESASAFQHFASTVGVFAGLGSLGEFFLG